MQRLEIQFEDVEEIKVETESDHSSSAMIFAIVGEPSARVASSPSEYKEFDTRVFRMSY